MISTSQKPHLAEVQVSIYALNTPEEPFNASLVLSEQWKIGHFDASFFSSVATEKKDSSAKEAEEAEEEEEQTVPRAQQLLDHFKVEVASVTAAETTEAQWKRVVPPSLVQEKETMLRALKCAIASFLNYLIYARCVFNQSPLTPEAAKPMISRNNRGVKEVDQTRLLWSLFAVPSPTPRPALQRKETVLSKRKAPSPTTATKTPRTASGKEPFRMHNNSAVEVISV